MSVLVATTAENGKYKLISGHRRLAAIKLLISERRRKSTTVPCYVKGEKSDEETQLDLIITEFIQVSGYGMPNISSCRSSRGDGEQWQEL